jgi:pSer/pThr/pTyr-binding forkhead associated (FHA) protein
VHPPPAIPVSPPGWGEGAGWGEGEFVASPGAALPPPATVLRGQAGHTVATPLIPPAIDGRLYQGTALHPPEKATGRLVVITKDGGEGASYPIYDQLDIGRSEGDVVVPEDRYLSARHARISRRSGQGAAGGLAGLLLRDLGSVNGVFLRIGNAMGGDGRVEVDLWDQDLFLVGQQVLKFEVVKDGEDGFGPASQHGTLLFGTPQGPRFATLSQRTVEGVTRDLFHIRKVETILGRESGDIVFTDDPFLSRRHALIKFDRDNRRFLLADLGSSNGTFVQIRGDVGLKSGDQFRIGQQLFRVELHRADS